MAISFSGIIFYLQHRVALKGTDRAAIENTELERAVRLKGELTAFEQAIREKRLSERAATAIHLSIGDLKAAEESPDGVELLQRAEDAFDTYLGSVTETSVGPSQVERLRAFEELAATVESYVAFKQDGIYRMAFDSRQRQESTIKVALLFLVVFLIALWVVAYRVIGWVTAPLTAIANYIDGMSIERPSGGTHIPHSDIPEIRSVTRSFERLLARLQGYQAINLHRLLVEKRRADVIAESISDGVFLLRGEELIYANPVGERILSLPEGASWKGLHLVRRLAGSANANDPTLSRGVRAVLSAAQHTIPVEFELKTESRKQFYLLQSFPIPEELIERVEHSFDGPVESLERWQANTLVVARDVTLVRESQEAKSHFIATLSHEVKTPVTSLTMATRLLKKSVEQIPNPTHRALVETCAEDVDRLRVLIDDLLSVSRFDTLTQRLDIKKVDLAKLLRQTVQHFQPQAFERGVEIVTRLPDRRPVRVSMDATKLSWALSNLMINALRHTPRGGRVEAVLDLTAEAGQAVVRIRDHGPGIDPERKERIFDKFNPFYDLRVARSGTLGMGLAIAREIVLAHRGRIWVVSEPGQGAEFCFSLPLKDAATEAVGPAVDSRNMGAQEV